MVVASSGPYAEAFFVFKKKKKQLGRGDFLNKFFVLLNMGPYGSENFKTLLLLQITAESFQLFLNFLSNGPHKTTFAIFEILKIEILTNFIRFR